MLTGVLLLPAHVAFGLEFSGDHTIRVGTKTMTGKVFFKPDRWRVEMASPEGPRVSIHRMDKVVTWLLLPNQTYVEIPFKFDQVPQVGPKIEGEVSRKKIGSEEIGGRKTEKYEVTVEGEGKREIVYQWVAPDINFAIKTAGTDGKWESTYHHVTIAPQKPDLFEIPAGYQKMPLQR
jgi:hypothetical protein